MDRSRIPNEFFTSPGDYAALIVPGGNSEYFYGRGEGAAEAKRLIRQMVADGKWVGGIGSGVRVLGEAGVLRGLAVASQNHDLERLRELGVKAEDVPLKVSAPVITARSGWDKDAFVKELLEAIGAGD